MSFHGYSTVAITLSCRISLQSLTGNEPNWVQPKCNLFLDSSVICYCSKDAIFLLIPRLNKFIRWLDKAAGSGKSFDCYCGLPDSAKISESLETDFVSTFVQFRNLVLSICSVFRRKRQLIEKLLPEFKIDAKITRF